MTEDTDEWEATDARIHEFPIGPDDDFPEFAETVRSMMENVGNQIGKPVVMKVEVKAVSGTLNRELEEESG